ncbi:DUF2892 domain-containing protein [Flavobacterium sp.]|uniref:YgaP family membrane protein n=1 Tax=Flavobacterium sp. TaxID=239 RepID=UPI00261EEDDA|nr:DUF2892 domain-containing protein [Flavobacterium sp.]
MKKNIGKADKMLRMIVALVVAMLYFNNTINGFLASILIVLAVVFSITSLIGFCPLYLPFGINTNENKE